MSVAKLGDRARWKAALLLGPTGSGKTPLGRLLAENGFSGLTCLHFDFGEALRRAAKERSLLTESEHETVIAVLRSGELLEDRHFGIAEKLLERHVSDRSEGDMLLVLNGLPRHLGQAVAMQGLVEMRALIELQCTAEIAWERIRHDTGGDRDRRTDDSLQEVRRRCTLYYSRTAPLREYYRSLGVRVIGIDVGSRTTAPEMLGQLAEGWHSALL